MKNKFFLFVALVLIAGMNRAAAQGTAFTYQGQLIDGGVPANGTNYGMVFYLYDAPTNGTLLGNEGIVSVTVSNGLFTVPLDFGSVFDGTPRWLEITVQKNGGSFATLTPLQQLTPTPYAIFANTASNLTGTLPASQLSGTIVSAQLGGTYSAAVTFNDASGNFSGIGSGLTGVDAASLNGLGAANFWQTGGNAGTTAGVNYVGTTDNQPLEMHVNGLRALRLEPDTTGSGSPNVIGGSPENYMDAGGVIGGFIGGGGAVDYNGVAYTNRVSAYFGSIVGGYGNWIQSYGNGGYIGGGFFNTVENGAGLSVIGGGSGNTIQTNAGLSVIGGGSANAIQTNAGNSVIGGGYGNNVYYSTVTGGVNSTIGGGEENVTAGGFATVAGGLENQATNIIATVAGGADNIASAYGTTVGGGVNNVASGTGAFVGGGGYDGSLYAGNQANGNGATISGGVENTIQVGATDSTIGGGDQNGIQSNAANAFIGGGNLNSIQSAASYSVVGGGYDNSVQSNASYSAISGGFLNSIEVDANQACIGGGSQNSIQTSSDGATVGGGYYNIIQTNELESTIGGGFENQIDSSIYVNTIAGNTIAGGTANIIQSNALYSTIGGGAYNTNGNWYSTVPGGTGNSAGGYYSFAAGHMANARYQGDFVWADSQSSLFSATTSDQASFRCRGGVLFTSAASGTAQTVSWTPGTGSWSFSSDRNLKDRFENVDPKSVLDKVAKLPVVEWSYKTYPQRHIGAMAQDFHALFPLNNDDKSLNEADLHGVELAAIQGLNQKLNEKDAEIQELKQRLESLEKIVLNQKSN
jgi:hypothetical protein